MYLAFHIMGAVGFSKDFHMLDDGREHSAIRGLHDQIKKFRMLSSIPWFPSMASSIPGLAGSYALFTKWCGERVEEKERRVCKTE
jgi:hypothetical protein